MRQSIIHAAAAASLLVLFTTSALAADAETKTIEQVYQQKEQLAGKKVTISGTPSKCLAQYFVNHASIRSVSVVASWKPCGVMGSFCPGTQGKTG